MAQPVPPLNPIVKYIDPETSHGFSTTGFQYFSNLQAQVGKTTIAAEAPSLDGISKTPTAGTTVFVAATHTLYIFDGTQWRSTVLA